MKQDGSCRVAVLPQVVETEEAKEAGDYDMKTDRPRDLLAEIKERLKKTPY